MKKIFKNQFNIAIVVYFLFIGLMTIPILHYFPKIKQANEKYREKLTSYQNLQFKDNRAIEGKLKTACSGDLFFQTQAPITAMHVFQDHLYLSQANGKLTIIDLKNPKLFSIYEANLFTDFYSNSSELLGTDILNDRIVKIVLGGNGIVTEKVYTKIGRASALTQDHLGNFYVSGYASGNITKIVGRDKFLFAADLDKIVDLEINGNKTIYLARYESVPSFLSLELNQKTKNIIEKNKSFSALTSDGVTLWVAYNEGNQTKIGKIVDDKLVESKTLDCQFPLKIAFWNDKLFYTSLADSDGKVYFTKKNLQIKGK